MVLLNAETNEPLVPGMELKTEREAFPIAKRFAMAGYNVLMRTDDDAATDKLFTPDKADAHRGSFAWRGRCPRCGRMTRWPKASVCRDCRLDQMRGR